MMSMDLIIYLSYPLFTAGGQTPPLHGRVNSIPAMGGKTCCIYVYITRARPHGVCSLFLFLFLFHFFFWYFSFSLFLFCFFFLLVIQLVNLNVNKLWNHGNATPYGGRSRTPVPTSSLFTLHFLLSTPHSTSQFINKWDNRRLTEG